ncbi:hypothetical protein ACFQXA_14710 [Nocardiopsis composta]
MGTIGEVETDRGGGPAAAHWDGADDGAEGDQHFRSAPERAYSRVSADGAALSARASITDARFDPSCALLPAPGDGPDQRLAEAFGAEDLAAVDAVESRARWTEEHGATADLEVRGLEVLGEPIDLAAAEGGAVERTFTAEGPPGRSRWTSPRAPRCTTCRRAERPPPRPGPASHCSSTSPRPAARSRARRPTSAAPTGSTWPGRACTAAGR